MGAAYLAGLAVGYWENQQQICQNWSVDRTFMPEISEADRKKRIAGWEKAVTCARGWAEK